MEDQVNRLGFEAFADNLIVDAMENMGKSTEYKVESDNFSLVIRYNGPDAHAMLRAYVKGMGWKETERTFKR